MEALHKIVFWFTSRATEEFLRKYLEGELALAVGGILNQGERVEIRSKLSFLPRTDVGPVWEWYPKITAETDRTDLKRDSGGANDFALRFEKILMGDPSIKSIRRMK